MKFLKWAGGKRKSLPEIRKLLPKGFTNYYEPFLGGGAVYFEVIQPMGGVKSYLSDINDELINAYQCVCANPHTVGELLHSWPNNQKTYYQIRDGEYVTPVNRAARFIYINKVGFNGLYRVNKAGKCNTSYGGQERGTNYLPNILEVSQALQGTSILCHPYSAVRPSDNSFMYCDPPYNDTDAMYIDHHFNQEQFAAWVRALSCNVMVSHFDNPQIRSLYAGMNFHEINVRHVLSGSASGRRVRQELLITNY